MEQETTTAEPLPGEAGSHAWMLDYLKGLGEEQVLAGFGWTIQRGDKWATIAVSWQRAGMEQPIRREWRMVPVDREERRKVDGSG
jgi:hypothetical protein